MSTTAVAPHGVVLRDMSSRIGVEEPKGRGNSAGKKPEDLNGESRELGESVKERLSTLETAETGSVSSPVSEN